MVKGGKEVKLTKRQFSLLTILNENPGISVKTIAQKLHLTVSTVKKELNEMEELFKEYHVNIDINTKYQLIKRGEANVAALVCDAEKMIEFSIHYQILMFLCLHKDYKVMQDIADVLYVSKSLVEKQTTQMLKEYGVKLESIRHNGIRFQASEAERREYFVTMLSPYLSGNSYLEDMQKFHNQHFPILHYFEEETVVKMEEILDFIQKVAPFSLTDESRNLLFAYSLIQQYSIENELGTIESTFSEIMKDNPEKIQFDGVVNLINEHYELGLSTDEKNYLAYILMTLRKQKVLNNEMIISKMSDIIAEIYEKIERDLFIDLSGDKELTEGLSLHIYSTIHRRSFTENDFVDYQIREMRKKYPLGYEMATIAAGVINEYYDFKISENEMTYQAFHFQAAIERRKEKEEKLKTIVVCQYGSAAANLISAKIMRKFSLIQVTATMSRHEFLSKLNELKNIDLVLSTDKLDAGSIPVVRVSPALNQNQIDLIQNKILQHNVLKELSIYLMEADFIEGEYSSKEEIINLLVDQLEEENSVSEEYRQSVFDRENISSTSDGYVAIPHGDPSLVNDTRLVIMKLKDKIMWDEDCSVKYIFLFAFSAETGKRNKDLFSTFYRGLANPHLQTKLEEMDQEDPHLIKQAIINLISNGGQYD